MDPMHPFDPRRRKPAAGDKGNAEGGFKQLILHLRAFAFMAECRTMPHSAWLDCMVPRSPSRVRCAGLRPALDRAHRTLLSSPNPLEFQKRQKTCLVVQQQ